MSEKQRRIIIVCAIFAPLVIALVVLLIIAFNQTLHETFFQIKVSETMSLIVPVYIAIGVTIYFTNRITDKRKLKEIAADLIQKILFNLEYEDFRNNFFDNPEKMGMLTRKIQNYFIVLIPCCEKLGYVTEPKEALSLYDDFSYYISDESGKLRKILEDLDQEDLAQAEEFEKKMEVYRIEVKNCQTIIEYNLNNILKDIYIKY